MKGGSTNIRTYFRQVISEDEYEKSMTFNGYFFNPLDDATVQLYVYYSVNGSVTTIKLIDIPKDPSNFQNINFTHAIPECNTIDFMVRVDYSGDNESIFIDNLSLAIQ